MSLATLLDRTATITRKTQGGATDRYNTPTWTATSQANVPVYLEQLSATEDLAGREAQSADYLAVFPAGTTLDGSDTVTIDGVTYEVFGEPARPYRFGVEHHVEARLRRLSG